MQETEIVKEIRFKFNPSEEKEGWGEMIEEIIPEILDCVPRLYQPEFRLHDPHHNKHGNRPHKHDENHSHKGTSKPTAGNKQAMSN